MKNFRAPILALAMVGGVAACTPNAVTSAGPGPAATGTGTPAATAMATPAGAGSGTSPGSGSVGTSTGPGAYLLGAMPAGTVSITSGGAGHLLAHVDMFGLTPGSAHTMVIEAAGQVVQFPDLTADSAGDANVTLTSVRGTGRLPRHSRAVIDLGNGTASGHSQLAAEPIAETGVLPAQPGAAFAFHAVTAGLDGASLGTPRGRATLAFNAAAQTLTVTVTASGLTPGAHAAHIHLGSCRQQGPVTYMLADFEADAAGDIIHQTRVVTGVASVPGPGAWYLNLHQGGMSQILAGGVPTLYFRPMLCADLATFATAGGATPAASPTMAAASPTMPAASPARPAATPSMTAMPSSTPSAPASTEPAVPAGVPTHY